MDNAESRAYNLMQRLDSREMARKYATNVIQSIFLYKKQKSKNKNHARFYLINIKKYLRKFSKISNRISNTYDPSSLYEMMITNFNIMRCEIKMIKTNQDKILKYVGLEPIKFEIPLSSNSNNKIEDSSIEKEDSFEVKKKTPEQCDISKSGRLVVYRESDEEKLIEGEYFLILNV